MSPSNISSTNRYLFLILGLFVVIAATFAIRLQPGIIPDERQHFEVSQYYSEVWGIPKDTPDTYRFGYMGHQSFLYYWINGRIINLLNLFAPSATERVALVILRMINVLFSMGTLFYLYRLAREIIPNKGYQVLTIFLLANTFMFVFLSGGVNYDNLANLASIAAIYYLVRVIKRNDFTLNSLLSFNFLAFGSLVKQTILPIAFIVIGIWLCYYFSVKKKEKIHIQNSTSLYVNGIIFLILLIGNFLIYGVNILKYNTITPSCTQVLTKTQCEENAVYRRNIELRKYSLSLSRFVDEVTEGRDPIEYFADFWFTSMLMKTFGIMGHKNYFPNLIITFYQVLFIWLTFWVFREWKKSDQELTALIVIVLFYMVVLLLKNYSGELTTDFKHVAVQGRYFFPVLPCLYVILIYYTMKIRPVFLRKLTMIYMILLFSMGAPITFLWNFDLFLTWFI